MASRTESNTVYAAGLVQGIALVTFPAASTIFTSPSHYDLSSTQYGSAHAVTGYKPTSSQLSQGAQIVNQESKETNGNYTKSQQGLPDAISVP